MADAARLAELISEDFYGGRLDFSARKAPPGDAWSRLPEVAAVDKMPPTDATVATDRLGGVSGRTVRLFLTFVAAMDKMRDASLLWRAAVDLFRTNPEVFDPAVVSAMPEETLGQLLSEARVTKYHGPQTRAWRTIAASLAAGNGPVCRVVDSGYGDATELLKDVRSRDRQGQARFPELCGDKISLMWIRMMAEPGKARIRPPGKPFPVAVDVQVRRVTENLGVTDTRGQKTQQQDQEGDSERLVCRRRQCPDRRSRTDRRNLCGARSGAVVLRQARMQPLRECGATREVRPSL